MTAAPARTRASADVSPGTVIQALHRALYAALVPKRDGSRHHRSCRESQVNSRWYGCSDACRFANGALLLAEDWESEHAVEAPRQARLWEAV